MNVLLSVSVRKITVIKTNGVNSNAHAGNAGQTTRENRDECN